MYYLTPSNKSADQCACTVARKAFVGLSGILPSPCNWRGIELIVPLVNQHAV